MNQSASTSNAHGKSIHLTRRVAILVTLWLALEPALFAWGPEGHRIVATIAFQLLPEAIKTQVEDILGDEDFVEVSNWADVVRLSRPQTKDWHFVDIPVTEAMYDQQRDCQTLETGDCAIAELARARAVLNDRTQPVKARHEALKFIIHFVGDIHQPLHSATNGSRENGDRGGNSVNTRLLTHTMKLHAAWDHGLIELDDRDESEYADGLIDQFVKTEEVSDTWTVVDWVNEAHGLAVGVGYKYPGFKANVIPTQKVLLGQAYVNRAKPVVDLQLARAGVRLARLLQDTLGAQ